LALSHSEPFGEAIWGRTFFGTVIKPFGDVPFLALLSEERKRGLLSEESHLGTYLFWHCYQKKEKEDGD